MGDDSYSQAIGYAIQKQHVSSGALTTIELNAKDIVRVAAGGTDSASKGSLVSTLPAIPILAMLYIGM